VIPTLIHFVWLGPARMPDWARTNIARFAELNPERTVIVHDQSALLSEYRDAWNRCRDVATRSDLVRYSVLQRHGGWYFDTDFVPIRPLADVERMYGLDGSRLVLSRQAGNRNPLLTVANSPLACGRNRQAVWNEIQRRVLAADLSKRTAAGPVMTTALAAERPHLVKLLDACWFFPACIGRAGSLYQRGLEHADEFCAATNGEKPIAMHLWAGGRAMYPTVEAFPSVTVAGRKDGPYAGKKAVVVSRLEWYRRDDRWFSHVATGLAELGFRVEVRDPADAESVLTADVAAVWNGRNSTAAHAAGLIRKHRIPCLWAEHGFYQRSRSVQIDHAGFLHEASWSNAEHLNADPPAWAWPKLHRLAGDIRRPQAIGDGHVLILGQVPGDTQMDNSEIRDPVALQRLLADPLKRAGVPAYFRPHPQMDHHERDILFPLWGGVNGQERDEYAANKHGRGLDEALEGCRFVIAVNSNALNEALIAGVPAMAFGPSIGLAAGVFRRATPQTIDADLHDMLCGWAPPYRESCNYLAHLAARQWDVAELDDGRVLAGLLEAAGVRPGKD